ncbi:MAG: hypothetical protein M3552_20650 [Planctomycetota bacterium]|nr:hypothetical protein [Planctomycetota bacterium]
MAIAGIERMRLARECLHRSSDADPRFILGASSEIWSAMFEVPHWPTELRMKAVGLQSILFRYGTIRMTIDQMVEPERMQLKRELLSFIDTAERLDGLGDGRSDGQNGPPHGISSPSGVMREETQGLDRRIPR